MTEAEDIIWENDEESDGYIEWSTFVQAYLRCKRDKSGKEPRRLYNLIVFMICDKDGGGTMSEDECAEVLFNRFGRSALAADMSEKLFKEAGSTGGFLTFEQFLKVLHVFESDHKPTEEELKPKKR